MPMDLRERWENPEEIIRTAIEAKQAEIQTALPAIVDSVDFQKQTLSARVAIKAVRRKDDGSLEHVEYPPIHDVPIHFPSGGGVSLTFPIKQGDEVLLMFASRPIDSWHQSGGVQQQVDARMHSLSDAFAIPGFRSKPRALSNVSTTATQIRSDDGHHVIEVHPTDGIALTSTTRLKINATGLDCLGDLNVVGDVVADSNGTAISLLNHHHGGVVPGGGNTAKPNGNG